MSGGGKGGSQTSTVKLPEWLEDAAQENLSRAKYAADTGPIQYRGPDVAAFNPMQQAAFQGTGQMAGAFGMAGGDLTGMEGMPQPQEFAGGFQGYSSAPIYDEAMEAFKARAPGQYEHAMGMFVDPITGQPQQGTFGVTTPAAGGGFFSGLGDTLRGRSGDADYNPRIGGGSGGGIFGGYEGPSRNGSAGYGAGGYTSFGDMFDGGGAGQSGGAYSGGGLLSDAGNAMRGR